MLYRTIEMAGVNQIMQSKLVSEGQTLCVFSRLSFLDFLQINKIICIPAYIKQTRNTNVEVRMSKRSKGTNRSRMGRWEMCSRNEHCAGMKKSSL